MWLLISINYLKHYTKWKQLNKLCGVFSCRKRINRNRKKNIIRRENSNAYNNEKQSQFTNSLIIYFLDSLRLAYTPKVLDFSSNRCEATNACTYLHVACLYWLLAHYACDWYISDRIYYDQRGFIVLAQWCKNSMGNLQIHFATNRWSGNVSNIRSKESSWKTIRFFVCFRWNFCNAIKKIIV